MIALPTGRPLARERRTAILQAAARVFFEQGYAATSIDAIIDEIGGSKRNIYNEFGNKEGLFTALVTEIANEALQSLEVEHIEGLGLKEILKAFGWRLAHSYMSPTLLGVYRIIVADGQRFPKLAQAFYDKGPGRATARLTEVLQAAQRNGEANFDDSATAANHFVAMVRGNLHLQVVLALRPHPTESEIRLAVDTAVEIFIRGIRGTPQDPAND